MKLPPCLKRFFRLYTCVEIYESEREREIEIERERERERESVCEDLIKEFGVQFQTV